MTEPAGDVAQSLLVGNNGGKVKKKGRMNINCCLVQCPAIHPHSIFSLRSRLTVFSPQLSLQRLPKVPVPAANLSSSAFGVGDISIFVICDNTTTPRPYILLTRLHENHGRAFLKRKFTDTTQRTLTALWCISHAHQSDNFWGKDCLFRGAKVSSS